MKNMAKLFGIIALLTIMGNQTTLFAQSAGGRTDAFFKMFSSGNYHMKAQMLGGEVDESTIETYVKDDRMASVISAAGEATRIIIRDNKTYIIIDSARMVIVAPLDNSSETGRIETEGMRFTGSGTAIFAGKSLPYEEYSSPDGIEAQYFLDGNRLAGIRNIVDREGTIDIVILELDQNVPNNVFDIPSGYQVQDMTNFGQY